MQAMKLPSQAKFMLSKLVKGNNVVQKNQLQQQSTSVASLLVQQLRT